jgi:hypothetical protein
MYRAMREDTVAGFGQARHEEYNRLQYQLSSLAQNTARQAVILPWHVLAPEPATNPI